MDLKEIREEDLTTEAQRRREDGIAVGAVPPCPPHQEEKFKKKIFEKIRGDKYVDLLPDLIDVLTELKQKHGHLITRSDDPLEMLVRRRNEFDPETYSKPVEGYELKPCPFCGETDPVKFNEYAPEYEEGWHGKMILFELGCCRCNVLIHASGNTSYLENNRERLLQDMVDRWNERAGEKQLSQKLRRATEIGRTFLVRCPACDLSSNEFLALCAELAGLEGSDASKE